MKLLSKAITIVIILLTGGAGLRSQIPASMNETTGTGLGGFSFIVGTVFLPSGRKLDYRLRVRLVSPMRGEISASTDDRGQFLFSGVTQGDYAIVIDGDDFEPYRQQVEVSRSLRTSPDTYTLTVRLSSKNKDSVKPGVIYSGDANATKKALSLYKEAKSLINEGDSKRAIEKLKLAVAESPDFVSALNELASQYMTVGDLETAEKRLREALARDANAVTPIINLGILLFRQKRFADAEQYLAKAIGANAKSAVAHFYLGRTYLATQRPEAALKELNTTVAIGDEFKEAHRLLAVLYLDLGNRKRVVEELETYLRLVPNAKDADELRLIIKQNKSASHR